MPASTRGRLPSTPSGGRWLLAGVALLAAVGVAAALRLRPPAPLPADAHPGAFSAGRAVELLRALAPDGEPHPLGSPANARVRDRLVSELRRLGCAAEVQRSFACGRFGFCADVENVVARLEGQSPGKALLLMAHYDGAPAGPGVSDNLGSVAVLLEAARALNHGPPPARPVVLLFTDGEEGGLIGATAFASEHPWARDLAVVVNADTRGTSGPSVLFETIGEDGWLVRRVARALPHPIASSVFAAIYREMPMESDLSVFAASGASGLNLAYIHGAATYHTPLDDLRHVTPASLQHHGESVLSVARSLSSPGELPRATGDRVFFDLLGVLVVHWPQRATLPLAGLAALLWLAVAVRRRGETSLAGVALGLVAFLLAPAAAAAFAYALREGVAAAGAGEKLWLAHPLPARLSAWSAGLVAPLLAGAWSRRAGPGGLRAGIGAAWCGLALALAARLPGSSYLALLPALAFGLAGLPGALGRGAPSSSAWDLVPALAGAAVLLPLALIVEAAGGLLVAPAVAALVALAALPLAPLAASAPPAAARRWSVALGSAMAAAGVAAVALPAFTPESPEHVILMFRQDADSGRARWLVHAESGVLPPALRAVAGFGTRPVNPFDWAVVQPSFEAEASPVPAPGPELSILERRADRDLRRIRARVTSPRGGREVYLVFPPQARLAEVRIRGRRAQTPPAWLQAWFGGFQVYRCLTLPPDGVEVEFALAGTEPVEVEIVDQTPGLPPAGERLLSARPPEAATFQEGDATYFTRVVRL
jgi:hypothetical protein